MADEGRIGGIDGRSAADEDDAARKARQHFLRPVGSMNLQDIAVLEGKVRHRGEGAVAHDDHVAAREFEETLDISDVFAAAIALPRPTAAEAELPAESESGRESSSDTTAVTIAGMNIGTAMPTPGRISKPVEHER